MTGKIEAAMVLAILAAGGAGREAWAEPAAFEARGVIVATTSHAAAVPGASEGHQAFLNVYDGAVLTDEAGAFLADARYQIVELIDTGGLINGGYKVFTTPDGTVFGRYEVRHENHPNYEGTWTFTGGTGRFEAITGSGTFSALALSDTALIDTLTGEYELAPAR